MLWHVENGIDRLFGNKYVRRARALKVSRIQLLR
jgi:hypothetical protein